MFGFSSLADAMKKAIIPYSIVPKILSKFCLSVHIDWSPKLATGLNMLIGCISKSMWLTRPKWFSDEGIILAKGQFDHSYTFWTTLQMFCLQNPQIIACKPNPKTTSSDFNRLESVTKIFCFHAISKNICLLF